MRTAMYNAAYLLETFGYELEVEQQDPEDFAVTIAVGDTDTIDLPSGSRATAVGPRPAGNTRAGAP
jgi:prophage maintenance system killer protein